jgi:hypothetical protein
MATEAGSALAPEKRDGGERELSHVSSSFEFDVEAPLEQAAPMFGPGRESDWLEHWKPQFIYPRPPQDIVGAVFTVRHADQTSIWVTTVLDFEGGHLQYVALIPDAMVSVIDVRLRATGMKETHVVVQYVRTALTPEMNNPLRLRAEADGRMGPEWSEALNSYFRQRPGLVTPPAED